MTYRIGCYISPGRLRATAEKVNADLASVFLGNPRSFHGPLSKMDPLAEGFPMYAHAPYTVDIPHNDRWVFKASVELLKEHAKLAQDYGCLGLVVHGGSYKGSRRETGIAKWEAAAQFEYPVPILIENQAGGNATMTCTEQEIHDVWQVVKDNPQFGFCFDTAHAWGHCGFDSINYAARVKDIVSGRIGLIHSNGSAIEGYSGRDKHAPFRESIMPFPTILGMIDAIGCEDLACESRDPKPDIEMLRDIYVSSIGRSR